MTQLLKDQQRRDLEAFALGFVLGSQHKSVDFDSDKVEVFSVHRTLAKGVAKCIEADDMPGMIPILSNELGVKLGIDNENIYDEVFLAITTDSMLTQIAYMANNVTQHGKNQLNTDMLKAIHELTGKYLELTE